MKARLECNQQIHIPRNAMRLVHIARASWKNHLAPAASFSGLGSLTRPPVAILLGWLRADPRHLSKYSDLYLRAGIDTITATLPARCTLLPTWTLQPTLAQLAGEITGALERLDREADEASAAPLVSRRDNGSTREITAIRVAPAEALGQRVDVDSGPMIPVGPRPLIAHTFSGNGANAIALLHAHPSRCLQHGGRILHAALFDSGPVLLRPPVVARGLLSPFFGEDAAARMAAGLALPAATYLVERPAHARIVRGVHQALRGIGENPDTRILVVGGTEDRVVEPAELMSCVDFAFGSRAHVAWFKAAHVQAYRTHSEAYAELVYEFLKLKEHHWSSKTKKY